jgi:hypothetical protein
MNSLGFGRWALSSCVAAAFLAGCGGSQPPIAAPGHSLRLPLPSLDDNGTSPLALRTCATRPPQHEWILKGACQAFDLTSTGGHFRLGEYQSITVKGSIGKNTARGTVKFALADAIDKNGDIEPYKGKAFPRYEANPKYYEHNITYVYAAAVNESTQVIKPIPSKGKWVLRFTITNALGFGDANTCGAALLTSRAGKHYSWAPLPTTGLVMGKTVTITQYGAPRNFGLPPKIPVYVAVNCYKQ